MASYKKGFAFLGYTMWFVCESDELRDLWILVTASGLVVRVSGYRYRDLGFDSRRYQIF